MPSRVSIVIPNFNYARFLPRSIESALRQKGAAVEVVVVDDASTDNSHEVIAGYGDRVRSVLKERNGGHGAAFNAGFAASTGEIVIFLDADDYLYPGAARRILENGEPGVAQYQYRLDLVDAEGHVLDLYPPAEVAFEDGDVRPALLKRGRYSTTVTSGLAFARSALERALPLDEEAFRQGADGYLVTVMPFYGRVKTLDEVLGAYCQHGGNHSQFATAVAKRARWRIGHDEMRQQALMRHAWLNGLRSQPHCILNDALHLEERIASLVLEPALHPYPDDRRAFLARRALAASRQLPISRRRRHLLNVWWSLVGYGPLFAARRAVAWKLQSASRPAFIKTAARFMRRAAG